MTVPNRKRLPVGEVGSSMWARRRAAQKIMLIGMAEDRLAVESPAAA
jgi:hypothetical protein